ncbi:hypothetical protein [Halovivax gelatinilyticus]|uniref:transcriptional regulator FilR1 domain-containing protein n=1 Tax=Halovivax gelatinilyticus TaxID=2961597 RepID=UPI0020CA56B1|nr:hypothetical protein [Halovivax gelatinilyticus]
MPSVTRSLVAAHETVLEREDEIEVVVGPSGLEGIQSSNLVEPSSACCHSLYAYDRPMEPIGIVRADDRTFVLIYDEYGTVHGLIINSHDEFREWGWEFYENHRTDAVPVDPSDVRTD